MRLPIIGSNTAEKLAKLSEEEQINFHQEKRIELLKWEIDNECLVTNQLRTENTESKMAFESVMFIKKATTEAVEAMKKSLTRFEEELNNPKN